MADHNIKIGYADLVEFTRACLVAAGSSPENAVPVAEVLVEADKRGITSHGVNRLRLYCSELERGAVAGSGGPSVVKEGPATVMVDGNNVQGAVVGKFCMELAMRKARESGCAWVVARNTNHYGIAGYYAMMAADAGLIGLSMTNTSPVVFPTRSRKAAIGTNPIACAAPTLGPPVVLDMATPAVALGKVEVCHRKGIPCPEGWGFDGTGAGTTDPSAILFGGGGLQPLGGSEATSGFKGYGLGVMVEMLCGVLGGANFGPNLGMACNPNAVDRTEPINLGQCFIAIDPSWFCDGYPERLQRFVDQLHSLPTNADAPGPVLVPGDPERQHEERQMRDGIDLHVNIVAELAPLGRRLGVTLPLAFANVL